MALAKLNEKDYSTMYAEAKKEYENYVVQNLKLNMARGKPSSEQLDLANDIYAIIDENTNLMHKSGEDLRNYGIWDGLPESKEIFSSMMDVPASQIIIGNNSSLSLMYEVISRGFSHGYNGQTPWCKLDKIKFLCPVPGYDRHFGITEYFGFEMINIPMDENGPDMDMIEDLVSKDESIKGVWCVPKYSNPTGITYSDETVKRFANLKPLAKDFKIMWDNAYSVHHLTEDGDELLGLYDECVKAGTEDTAVFFSSTSKITIAGAGVSAVACGPNTFKELQVQIMTKTIGPDKINEQRHILFLKNAEGVKAVMAKHKNLLAPKFEKVCEVLEEELGGLGVASWNKPNGGYFVSVDVLGGSAKRVVGLCKDAGVVLTGAGATYPLGIDPEDSNIRIAPSFPPVSELEIAMKLFCVCVKLAVAEANM